MADMPDLDLIRKSVTAGDVTQVTGSGVIQMIIPFSSYGRSKIALPPEPPMYWVPARDDVLRATVHKEAMWAGAVGIAITKAASLGWEIRSAVRRRRKEMQNILLYADTKRVGWSGFIAKHLRDFLTTDNGAFIEIVRASKAHGSKIIGLRHLDSRRCQRTGDPRIPVLFYDRRGQIHAMKDYQVIMISDMPDPGDTYYGVGLCAASRAYAAIYKLYSIEKYLAEKVTGQRPLAIHIVNGVLDQQLQNSVQVAKSDQQARGTVAYMGAIVIGVPSDVPAQVATIPLAELPDRFNRKEEFDISILTYANALGMDPQELQPLSGQPLGTGAQSQVLHEKASGKGIAFWRSEFSRSINTYLAPKDATTFAFSERDYRDMEKRAQVSKARVDVAGARIDKKITTPMQELQILVDLDELPREYLPQEQDVTPIESLSDTDRLDIVQRDTTTAAFREDGGPKTMAQLQAEAAQEKQMEQKQKVAKAGGDQPPGANGKPPAKAEKKPAKSDEEEKVADKKGA